MFAKKCLFLVVAVAVAAFAGCAGKKGKPLGGDPGGPIIVIEPVPDPEGLIAKTDASSDYTKWSAGCPDPAPPEAERADTYVGLPGRLGKEYGAEKISITKTSGDPFNVKKIVLHFQDSRVLTIELPESTLPTWTLENPNATVLKSKWQVPLHNWSHVLYGRIKDVQITDLNDKTKTIDVKELLKIEVFYNREKGGTKCK